MPDSSKNADNSDRNAPRPDKPPASPIVPPRVLAKPVAVSPIVPPVATGGVKPVPVAPKIVPATPVAPTVGAPAAAKPAPTSTPAAPRATQTPTPAKSAVAVPPAAAKAAPAPRAAAPATPSAPKAAIQKPAAPAKPAADAARPAHRPIARSDQSGETSPLGSSSPATATLPDPKERAVAKSPVADVKPVAPKLAEPARKLAAATKRPAGPDPLIGKTVGRCHIKSHLGAGRTANVYRAHHEGLGTDVAVKILLPEILKFPEVVAKFEQEARAIARLDHPNVLKIYDVVTEGDTRGIVMELLEGESVLEYLESEERVDPEDALRIVRQAASGLQAAHSKGIIHRDVKPQNLVILEDGTVKVVDFGLATQSSSSLAAERIGTPHYMAPEVCEAKPVEPASDVYSLGITLFHLLTGHPPYAGQTVKEILASHVAGKPLQPEREVKGLSTPLADLVRGMTKRDPLTRLSIDALIATIDRIGGEELVKQIKLAPRRGRRRRRAKSAAPMALAAGGFAVAIVIVVVAALPSKKGSPPDSPRTPPTSLNPSGEPEAPSTPGPTEASMADPTLPPPETAEQRREREKREADERKIEAERRFEKAEGYARANEADKIGIAQKYREIANDYPDLERGKEAKRRSAGIVNGTIHPHPDKKFAEKSAVDKAREEWEKARAPVEEAVAQKLYGDALRLLPQSVEDPDHKIGPELELWGRVLRKIPEFLTTLEKEASTLKPAERKRLGTPKGEGRWLSTSSAGPVVQVGSEKLDLRWGDVPTESIAALAMEAYDKKDVRLKAGLAAFAWAHRLREEFYRTVIPFKMAGEQTEGYDFVSAMLQRANERFAKPKDPKDPGDGKGGSEPKSAMDGGESPKDPQKDPQKDPDPPK